MCCSWPRLLCCLACVDGGCHVGASAAPAAVGAPFGYVTDFAGEGQAARIVYRTGNGHLQELVVGRTGYWSTANLTTLIGAPAAAPGAPVHGYATAFPGQGSVGRVVYRTTSGSIHELAVRPSGWTSTSLSGATGAPGGSAAPTAFVTDLAGHGPGARVLYPNGTGQVIEIAGGR